jgi:predicted phosphodiesterase
MKRNCSSRVCLLLGTVLLLLCSTEIARADEGRSHRPRKQPQKKEDFVPRPPAGTLLLGPYLVDPDATSVRVRWEVMGELDSEVVLTMPDGKERHGAGLLRNAEELTFSLPGRVYEAEVNQLESCTTYSYRLLPFDNKDSPLRSFRTSPLPGKLCPDGVRIMVYGDSRTNHKFHTSLVPAMVAAKPQLLVNIGDIVHSAKRVYEWHKFFQIERELLASAPIAIAPGNHEAYHGEDYGAELMRRYFRGRSHGGTGHYSFDYGPCHFAILDLYWGEPIAAAGREWLRQDLASVPEGRYKFVVLHAPIYSFGHHAPTEELKALRPLLAKMGVTAVFSGHSHVYEHFNVEGIHYLTVGGTGAPFHTPNEHVVEAEEQYQVKTGRFYHFLTMDATAKGIHFRIVDSKKNRVVEEWTVSPKESKP